MNKVTQELLEQALKETQEHGQAKCLQTADGRNVRIYALDHGSPTASTTVHGATFSVKHGWLSLNWRNEFGGEWNAGHPTGMLVPTPVPPVYRYINVYKAKSGTLFTSMSQTPRSEREQAAHEHNQHPFGGMLVGCMKIKLEERFDD